MNQAEYTSRAAGALPSGADEPGRIDLFLIGPGTVGSELLSLLYRCSSRVRDRHNLDIRLVGLAKSGTALVATDGIGFNTAVSRLRNEGHDFALADLPALLAQVRRPRLVVVDATASPRVADHYPEMLRRGIAVVTPNKLANTREQEFYDELRRLSVASGAPFFYDTTVGAALPIIETLRNLVQSGDRVRRIQGVLSGTLAFVCNEMATGKAFSVAVRAAHERGFTEPDPREDLAGEDVARKLLTLAREAGRRLERQDIVVEPLLSGAYGGADVESFLDALATEDEVWRERTKTGPVQYVATMDESGCRIDVEPAGADSPFASLRGTDNLVVFETDRYDERPLVIQGAGAGPVLTAAGVLTDVLRAAERTW